MTFYTSLNVLHNDSCVIQEPYTSSVNQSHERDYFESVVKALQADVTSISIQFTLDAKARAAYTKSVSEMAGKLRTQVLSGKISWYQAAEEANKTRNMIMEIMRTKSSPVGRAIAQQIKSQGKTLPEILSKQSNKLFGKAFEQLPSSQQNKVYAEVVKSAGKSNPRISSLMRRASYAGKALIVISITISVYNIATAEDKATATAREASVTAGGILGGAAGGAAAGWACGPGAPVCVAAGAIIGGALAAFGIDYAFFD